MFTGLVEATGRIERVDAVPGGQALVVATTLGSDLRVGESVAVNGVCLTVASRGVRHFGAHLSSETLAVTSLGSAEAGRLVNLERPVRADARLGGHFVLGHVDATGRIASLRPDGDGAWLDVETPEEVAPYLIVKGSISIDGISLTIARLTGLCVSVQIVPFTLAHTSLSEAQEGDLVNLEADVLGKYVVRFLAVGRQGVDTAVPVEQ